MLLPFLNPPVTFFYIWSQIHPPQVYMKSHDLVPTCLIHRSRILECTKLVSALGPRTSYPLCLEWYSVSSLHRTAFLLSVRPQLFSRSLERRLVMMNKLLLISHPIYIFYMSLLFAFLETALLRYTLYTIRGICVRYINQLILVYLQNCV